MLINIDLLVVCCCLWTAQICDGLLQLTAISRTDLSQHTSLSGDITLPWTCEALQGTVQVQRCAVVYLNTVSLCVASREKQLLLFLCSQICSKIDLSGTPFYLQAKENAVQISICIIMFCSFDLCSWIIFFKTLAHLYIYTPVHTLTLTLVSYSTFFPRIVASWISLYWTNSRNPSGVSALPCPWCRRRRPSATTMTESTSWSTVRTQMVGWRWNSYGWRNKSSFSL